MTKNYFLNVLDQFLFTSFIWAYYGLLKKVNKKPPELNLSIKSPSFTQTPFPFMPHPNNEENNYSLNFILLTLQNFKANESKQENKKAIVTVIEAYMDSITAFTEYTNKYFKSFFKTIETDPVLIKAAKGRTRNYDLEYAILMFKSSFFIKEYWEKYSSFIGSIPKEASITYKIYGEEIKKTTFSLANLSIHGNSNNTLASLKNNDNNITVYQNPNITQNWREKDDAKKSDQKLALDLFKPE